jgi:hypothetical protein
MEKLLIIILTLMLVSSSVSAFNIFTNPINQYYNKAKIISNVNYTYTQTIGSNSIDVNNGAFYALVPMNNSGSPSTFTVQGFDKNQQYLGNLTYSIVNQNGTSSYIEIPHMPVSVCAQLASASTCQAVEWSYAVIYYSPVLVNPKQGNYCSKTNPDPITGVCPIRQYPNPAQLFIPTGTENLSINTQTTFYSAQYSYTGVVPIPFELPYVFVANKDLADNTLVKNFNITYRPDAAHQYQIGECTGINNCYFLQNLGLANFHCSWWIFGCGNAFVIAPASNSLNAQKLFYGKTDGVGYEGYFGSTSQSLLNFTTYPILTETEGVDRNQSFMFNGTVSNVPISIGANLAAGQWKFNVATLNGSVISTILLPAFTMNYTTKIITLNGSKVSPYCSGGAGGWYACQFQYRVPFTNVSWTYGFNTLADYHSLGNVVTEGFNSINVHYLEISMNWTPLLGGNCAQVQFDASNYTDSSSISIYGEKGVIPYYLENCTSGTHGTVKFILDNFTSLSFVNYDSFYMYLNDSYNSGEISNSMIWSKWMVANHVNYTTLYVDPSNMPVLVNLTYPLNLHSYLNISTSAHAGFYYDPSSTLKYIVNSGYAAGGSGTPAHAKSSDGDSLFIIGVPSYQGKCGAYVVGAYSYRLGIQPEIPICHYYNVSNATSVTPGGFSSGWTYFISLNLTYPEYADIYKLYTTNYTIQKRQYYLSGGNATCTACKLNKLPTQIAFNLNVTTTLFGIAIPVDVAYVTLFLLFIFAFIIGSKSDMFILPVIAEIFGFVLLLEIGGFEVALLGALLMFMSYEFGRKVKVK